MLANLKFTTCKVAQRHLVEVKAFKITTLVHRRRENEFLFVFNIKSTCRHHFKSDNQKANFRTLEQSFATVPFY